MAHRQRQDGVRTRVAALALAMAFLAIVPSPTVFTFVGVGMCGPCDLALDGTLFLMLSFNMFWIVPTKRQYHDYRK